MYGMYFDESPLWKDTQIATWTKMLNYWIEIIFKITSHFYMDYKQKCRTNLEPKELEISSIRFRYVRADFPESGRAHDLLRFIQGGIQTVFLHPLIVRLTHGMVQCEGLLHQSVPSSIQTLIPTLLEQHFLFSTDLCVVYLIIPRKNEFVRNKVWSVFAEPILNIFDSVVTNFYGGHSCYEQVLWGYVSRNLYTTFCWCKKKDIMDYTRAKII